MSLLLWAVFLATGESQTLIDLRTQTKSVDFSAAGSTKPIKTGASLPATCTPGEVFFLTSAPSGNNVHGCNPVNVWTAQGANLSVNSGTKNQVLSSDGNSTQWVALGGDVSGAPGAVTVNRLQGRNVGNAVPSDGQVLKWNATTNAWEPAAGQTGNSSFVFVSQTAITIPGSVHQFGTANLIVDCYDGSIPARHVEPDTIQINAATYDVTIAFSAAQSGYCVVNGAGTAGGSGGGGGGITTLGGDLGGNTAAATVTGIQNRVVASTAPTDGQALVWSAAVSRWQPANVSGGGGGAAMASQLGDFAVVRASSTVLSIGANCSSALPCNVRFGYQVYSITNSATATISGSGTGTAYVYVTGSGNILVGHNLTVACSSGCTQQTGVTSFPANVIPIFFWTATNGTWDTAGGHDQRALLSAKTLTGGQGILVSDAPGQSSIAVDTGMIPTYLTNSAVLSFPSIPAAGCSSDLSLTVAGANTGDAVAPGWPATLPSGLLGIMLVGSSNTVSVRLCNLSASAVQPPSATYRATIVRTY